MKTIVSTQGDTGYSPYYDSPAAAYWKPSPYALQRLAIRLLETGNYGTVKEASKGAKRILS